VARELPICRHRASELSGAQLGDGLHRSLHDDTNQTEPQIGVLWFLWGNAGVSGINKVQERDTDDASGNRIHLVHLTTNKVHHCLAAGRGEETGESLTGRLPLWEDLYEYIGWKPWGGYGYEAFWNKRHISDIAESQQWTISEAHSSYIEATIQVGIIGAALMTAAAVSTLFYAAIIFRKTLRPEYLFLVGGVFLTLVRGFTEVGMSTPTGGFAFLILALTAHSWHTPTKLIDRNRSVDNDSNSP